MNDRSRPRLNHAWHLANPMPRNPTMDERVHWHLAHVQHCGCRGLPASILAELERRGRRPEIRT